MTPAVEAQRDRQLLRRAVWINFAGLLGKGFWPLFLWLVAARFGPEIFGQFTLLYAPVEILLALCSTGFLDGIYRSVARLPGEPISAAGYAVIRVSLRAVLALGLLAALLLLAGGGWLVSSLWGRPALHLPLVVMALSIPLTGTMSILLTTLSAMVRNEYEVVIKGALVPLLALAFAALASVVSQQLMALAIAYVAAQALGLLIALGVFARFGSLAQLRRGARDADGREPIDVAAHVRFGLLQGVNVMLWVGVYSLDTLLLGRFVGDTALAMYRAASELARVLQYVRTQFSSAFLPIAGRYLRKAQRAELQQLIHELGRTIIRHAVLLAGVLSWIAAPVVHATLHPDAPPGDLDTRFIDVLLLGHLAISALALAGNTLVLAGKQRLIFASSALMTVLNLALNLLLVPRWGLLGAATATLAAMAVAMLAQAAAVRSVLGLTMSWPAIASALGLGAIAYAVALGVTGLARHHQLAVSATAHAALGAAGFALTYAALTRLRPAGRPPSSPGPRAP